MQQPLKYDFSDMEGEASVRLAEIAGRIGASYKDGFGVNHLDGVNLPRRSEIVAITEKLLEVVFPGFDGRRMGRSEMLGHDIAELLKEIYSELFDQMCRAIRYSRKVQSCEECGTNEAVFTLLDALPEIRATVKIDVEAAYAGDPAATSHDEIILSYPGIKAITIQRMAHVLYHQRVPFIPRMMTEYAHGQTGIDIHPGAHLGRGIFIDHGTGVVIGETCTIGKRVKLYQGVTLGALSFDKDENGMLIKGTKRHPDVEDNVVIYAGATILGGRTVIGHNSVIGGNVWLIHSVPPGSIVYNQTPKPVVRTGHSFPEDFSI